MDGFLMLGIGIVLGMGIWAAAERFVWSRLRSNSDDNEWLGGSMDVEESPIHRAGRHGIGLGRVRMLSSLDMDLGLLGDGNCQDFSLDALLPEERKEGIGKEQEVRVKVLAILRKCINRRGGRVPGSDHDVSNLDRIISTYGADSLTEVGLILEYEETWGIRIPEEDYDKLVTVGGIVDYILEKI